MKSLIVAEKFYSMQGEGSTMGRPAVFLRLGGCNLLCNKEWRCDTIEVWQKGRNVLFEDIFDGQMLADLRLCNRLIITGGEPLLHQLKIIEFIDYLWSEHGLDPFLEIETNGTITPHPQLCSVVNLWNVSPKLSNSGEPAIKRINELALTILSSDVVNETNFKFVISKEEDMLEIMQDFSPHIKMEQVILMPAGSTQEELNKTRPMVVALAIKLYLRYCDRLHIVIWNQKTGV